MILGEPSATPGEERIDVDSRNAAYASARQINPDPSEWSLATSEQIAAVSTPIPAGMTSGSRPPAMNATNLRILAARMERLVITDSDIRHIRQWADYIEEWDRRKIQPTEPKENQ